VRVLLVEDDDGVGDALTEALAARGHLPTRVKRGADALTRHQDADLVLLDLKLPDTHGLEVLRMIRKVGDVPVLVLTASGDERTVVRGLRLGANDYVVKPVRLAELLARMDNVVGRSLRNSARGGGVVRIRDIEIDMMARRVRVGGEEISLTHKEFELLAILAREPGIAVSRQQSMDEIWGNADLAISRSLDVHMTQLRAKLGRPGLLVTIRGFGYRLDV
jgi:DNA-binding response OmpR family regulator